MGITAFAKELVTYEKDPEANVASSSKFWFNIANIAVTIAYLAVTYSVVKSASPPIGDFAWLTLVYSGIVATNKFANKFLDYKYTKTEVK